MATTPTPLTNNQWQKVTRAALYSFVSGFVGGFLVAATGALTSIANGGHVSLTVSALTAVVVSGVVGGLNTLAVFLKQLFSEN